MTVVRAVWSPRVETRAGGVAKIVKLLQQLDASAPDSYARWRSVVATAGVGGLDVTADAEAVDAAVRRGLGRHPDTLASGDPGWTFAAWNMQPGERSSHLECTFGCTLADVGNRVVLDAPLDVDGGTTLARSILIEIVAIWDAEVGYLIDPNAGKR